MMYGYNGLWGLLILAGDIWAVINILQSSASNEKKLLWTLVVVLLPLLGLILWYFLGPRDGRASPRTPRLGRSGCVMQARRALLLRRLVRCRSALRRGRVARR